MKPNPLIFFSLIILLLMSACGPGGSSAPPAPVATGTSAPAPTLTPVPATSTPSIGTVTGRIVNAAGLPITGIGVQLFRGNDLAAETKTSAEGEFTFRDVPPGTYRLRYDFVSSAGSVQHYYISEFVVKSGTTTQQDINHPN